jgi:membrane protein involved in colicin uptake
MIRIVNLQTGEVTEREFNAEELAQRQIEEAAELKRKAEAEAKATQKAALLERLGITEDEARLLLA